MTADKKNWGSGTETKIFDIWYNAALWNVTQGLFIGSVVVWSFLLQGTEIDKTVWVARNT